MRTITVREMQAGDTITVSTVSTGLFTHGGRTVATISVKVNPWGESADITFTDGVIVTGADPAHMVTVKRPNTRESILAEAARLGWSRGASEVRWALAYGGVTRNADGEPQAPDGVLSGEYADEMNDAMLTSTLGIDPESDDVESACDHYEDAYAIAYNDLGTYLDSDGDDGAEPTWETYRETHLSQAERTAPTFVYGAP